MERWVGRVALITGASSGIGAAVTECLLRHGMNVVGCSRNIEAIEVLKPSQLFGIIAQATESCFFTSRALLNSCTVRIFKTVVNKLKRLAGKNFDTG